MEREELREQYDRFLEQVRTEAKDLYWLFNFFFVIQSALVLALLSGRLGAEYAHLAEVCGILLALYWLIIVRKQRLWRNYWTGRIQRIETALGVAPEFQMWPPKPTKPGIVSDYLIGRRGVWRLLFFLPIGFAILWVVLYLRG